MIIDIDQILYVIYDDYEKAYIVGFKNNEATIEVNQNEYEKIVEQIKKLEDVGCSLLCL